jgi:hypothetical protein
MPAKANAAIRDTIGDLLFLTDRIRLPLLLR